MEAVADRVLYKTVWKIQRFADDNAYERGEASEVVSADGNVLPAVSVIEGNLLLNEGIAELWDLACGLGAPSAWSNANARIGVGDSSTAESASQTDLQASTNKAYKAMEASYPSRSGQTVTWRSVFASGDANYAWNEFTVSNTSSGTGKNLNRKVSSQGTKASGQTWTVDLAITLS